MFDVIFVTRNYDDNTYTDNVDTNLVRSGYQTQLAVCTCFACIVKNVMIMHQQCVTVHY